MKLPSVSRILDATMPLEKRVALEEWKNRVGHEEAERIREEAMERGNEIDRNVLSFKYHKTCKDQRIADYLTGFDFVVHEHSVVSIIGRYQGRLDAVLRINDRNILVDFKGASRKKPSRYLADYRLQLGAYYGACDEMGIGIDAACVVIFIEGTNKPQLYWQQLTELKDAHLEFLQRVAFYERLQIAGNDNAPT